ncbi:MAG TPA: hypothetical protein VFW28_06140 [Micropepsaceae bacterium]|nr:hypothetical protein [Micropepsaceae bacterium]
MLKIAMTHAAAAILALSLAQPVLAANSLSIKNAGNTPVQIGFDGEATQTIAPRATATIALDSGDHTAQCRFDGGFDRCNIEERFTLGEGRRISFSLLPVYTLRHAVMLAQQGALSVETRRDPVWATTPEDLAGRGADCTDYEAGKLATISKRVRSGMRVDQPAFATQTLCGDTRGVVAAMIAGEKLYLQPGFLVFRDQMGRAFLVQQ